MIFQVDCFAGRAGTEEHRLFKCHDDTWESMLELARQFGWDPQGTTLDEQSLKGHERAARERNEPLNLDAFVPDYSPYGWDAVKRVSADDALNLADALENAVENNTFPMPKKRPMIISEGASQDEHARINQFANEKLITEFIEFLKKGEFGFCYDD